MIHFLDIGANAGQTFDTYLRHHAELFGSTVYCFEPSPRHLATLMTTVEGYSDRFNIVVCPFGLGAENRVLRLHEKEDPMGDSFWLEFTNGLNQVIKDRYAPYRVYSSVMSISSFLLNQIPKGEEVIIKIDAECAEYEMLDDLMAHKEALEHVSKLMVEFHFIEGKLPETYMVEFEKIGHPITLWDL